MGVIYLGEKENVLSLDVFGRVETFKRHYVLEFDAGNNNHAINSRVGILIRGGIGRMM